MLNQDTLIQMKHSFQYSMLNNKKNGKNLTHLAQVIHGITMVIFSQSLLCLLQNKMTLKR
jgi:hypothetical protein